MDSPVSSVVPAPVSPPCTHPAPSILASPLFPQCASHDPVSGSLYLFLSQLFSQISPSFPSFVLKCPMRSVFPGPLPKVTTPTPTHLHSSLAHFLLISFLCIYLMSSSLPLGRKCLKAEIFVWLRSLLHAQDPERTWHTMDISTTYTLSMLHLASVASG